MNCLFCGGILTHEKENIFTCCLCGATHTLTRKNGKAKLEAKRTEVIEK